MSHLLEMVKRAKPGTFVDARLSASPENAIVYRARQPLIEDIIEVPMLQDFGIIPVSAIMAGRTQVGVCVRFKDNVVARVTQGNFATFVSDRCRDNPGETSCAMRTSDFLIFSFSSHGALILKKLTKGRGYGAV
jgi:hypothetical protein